ELVDTTFSDQSGIIYKGATPFIHNFNYGDNGTVTTAGGNTFIGENAGNFTMGSTATATLHSSYNTAIGYGTLVSNGNGYHNTAIGRDALNANISGHNNEAIGRFSLYSNTTGSSNIALGAQAGRYIADGSTPNETGGYNIFIGRDTKARADTDQNEIVIGYDAIGIGSNTVTLGADTIVTTALKGNVGIGTTAPSTTLTINGMGNVTGTWTMNTATI
ncbi:MAG: hypothetical protein GY706_01280, partial [Bacteroides sp.]|nr:hypothetical protein [Bacteroides sp.]